MRVTVDVVVFTILERALRVLLVQRGIPPFKGRWAIPGGFVHEREPLETAARRKLREETGVEGVFLEQLYSFGTPGRDPRGRTITIAYYALVAPEGQILHAGTDAAAAAWWRVAALPRLAFDHALILRTAVARLRGKLEYTHVGFELLPARFTLTELQRVHEAILARPIDKRNFRRKILGIVRPTRSWRREGIQRPARLFRFVKSPKSA